VRHATTMLSVATAIVVLGCGAASPTTTDPSAEGTSRHKRAADSSAEPNLPGTLIVLCGPDQDSTDLYEIREGRIERKTVSAPFSPVYSFSASERQIVFTQSAADVLGEQMLLARREPGQLKPELVGPGSGAGIREDGALVWVGHASAPEGIAVFLRDADGRTKRVRTFPDVWLTQFVGARLDVIVNRGARTTLLRGLDRKRRVKQRVELAATPFRHTLSSRGQLAYQSKRRVLRIVDSRGKQVAAHRTGWQPLAFDPQGKRLLVSEPETSATDELGVMDPKTGHVRRLGEASCGWVASAQWLDNVEPGIQNGAGPADGPVAERRSAARDDRHYDNPLNTQP